MYFPLYPEYFVLVPIGFLGESFHVFLSGTGQPIEDFFFFHFKRILEKTIFFFVYLVEDLPKQLL